MATISDFPPMNWGQFISIPNGTRIYNYGFDQCVAVANLYHVSVYGKPLPSGIGSAHQWWTTFGRQPNLYNNYVQSQTPVAGAVVVWSSAWGGGHGHIGVVTGVNANGTYNTVEQNAGTWRYFGRYTRGREALLGFLVPRSNPAGGGGAPAAANQRQVGSEPVNRRLDPNTSRPAIDPQLNPGEIGNFNGWIRGESVNGNNIWFRGISGNWFWSGGFTSQSTAGLQDLNPSTPAPTPSIDPTQRQVGSQPVRRREGPTTASRDLGDPLQPGTIGNFNGWIRGESVEGNNIWYRGISGNWFWSGAFTSQSTAGLQDLNGQPTPPAPPAPPAPTPGAKPTLIPGRHKLAESIANWDISSPAENPVYAIPTPLETALKLPADIEVRIEAANPNGYTVGRIDPGGANHFVVHHAATDSLQGAVNTLRGTNGAPTAHFVVKDKTVVVMVPTHSSAWTNTRWASNMFGINVEMVNAGRDANGNWLPPSAQTLETTAQLFAIEATKWKNLKNNLPIEHGINIAGHKEVSKSATACPGSVDVAAMAKRINEIIAGDKPVPPAPEPTPKPEPIPEPSLDKKAIAASLDVVAGEFIKISNILKGE